MVKKVVLGVALAGLVGVLVFGAVSRTDAKLDTGTAEGRSAQGYGQPEGDGPNDQQGGPRHGQADDSPGSGPEDAPRYGQADGRAQGGPYGPGDGSGYGPEGRPGRGQREGWNTAADCDGEDCDCGGDGPGHDHVDQRPLAE